MTMNNLVGSYFKKSGVLAAALLVMTAVGTAQEKSQPAGEPFDEGKTAPIRDYGAGLSEGGIDRDQAGQSALSGRRTERTTAASDASESLESLLRQELIATLTRLKNQAVQEGRSSEAKTLETRIIELQAEAGNSFATLRNQVGKRLRLSVVGRTTGPIWGGDDGSYTDDSDLGTAAVHAGVVAPGKRGTVEIEVQPGRDSYGSTHRNGVSSMSYRSWPGSYRIVTPGRDEYLSPALAPTATTFTFESPASGSPITPVQAEKGKLIIQLIEVVGTVSGSVWGDGVYTDDSTVGAAAVHAGILKPGERGTVIVQSLPGRDSYLASSRNGVTSSAYPSWTGSFQLLGVVQSEANRNAPNLGSVRLQSGVQVMVVKDTGNLVAFRGRTGEEMVIEVTGSLQGSVYGDGCYTDDSTLAVAAVHAGVLKPGETGRVKVTLLPGRADYAGVERNGIVSYSYGSWVGSYCVSRIDSDR